MKHGDVALVRFPFAELAAAKKRPVLIVARVARSPRNRLAIVAMITSQVESLTLPGDVLLEDWQAAGLLHPSLLRFAKVATVDEELIDKQIGRLSTGDLDSAREAFTRVFKDWLR